MGGGKNQYQSLGAVAATSNVNRSSPVQQPMTAFQRPMTPQQPMRQAFQQPMNSTSQMSGFPMSNNVMQSVPASRPMAPQSTQHNPMFASRPMMNPVRPAPTPFSAGQTRMGMMGMMGNQPMGGGMTSFGQPVMGNSYSQQQQQSSATKKLSSQELADFLG